MDDKQLFHRAFEDLTSRRRQVLERFLAGKTDAQIASELMVAETTVRKHIHNIRESFFVAKGRDYREELKGLFRQYKPELLGESSTVTPIPEEPQQDLAPEKITPMTGVVPLNSPLYIEREADRLCREALRIGSSRQTSVPFLRIKGARGLGKSSLLMRVRHWLETEQKQIVGFVDLGGFHFEPGAFTEFNKLLSEPAAFTGLNKLLSEPAAVKGLNKLLSEAAFTSLNKLLYEFTYKVAHSFSAIVPNLCPPDLREYWRDDVAAASNCTDYLETHIFAKIKQPKTLIIDGIDKVLGRKETQTPFLNLLRSWNEGKMKYVGQGAILWPSLAIAYSTEPYPHYDITDSPLQNVGIQVELEEFDVEQIVELAKDYYRLNLNINEVDYIRELIGGHPALLNEALYQISQNKIKPYNLENQPQELSAYFQKLGIEVERTNCINPDNSRNRAFDYFLGKNIKFLQAHEELMTCFKKILQGKKCTDEFAKYQLKLAGLVRDYPFDVRVSCELYRKFFTDYWGLDRGK